MLKSELLCAEYHLNFAKMSATWGEHQPAYYVATHTEKKEVVVAVRGTWAVEDVVTDITALPVVPPRTAHLTLLSCSHWYLHPHCWLVNPVGPPLPFTSPPCLTIPVILSHLNCLVPQPWGPPDPSSYPTFMQIEYGSTTHTPRIAALASPRVPLAPDPSLCCLQPLVLIVGFCEC